MKRSSAICLLLAIWALQAGARVYWFAQRNGLHNDEVITIINANCGTLGWLSAYPEGQIFTGSQVKDMTFLDDSSLRDVFADIGRLWYKNNDGSNSNFYYTLARIAMAGLKTGDIWRITPRLAALNMLLWTLSFVFFYKFLKLLFKDATYLPFLGLFFAFISTGSISTTIFFRTYQLQQLFFIVFAWLFCKSFTEITITELPGGKVLMNRRAMAPFLVVTSLALWTHYSSVIFLGIYGLYITWYYIKAKKIEGITPWLEILVLAFVVSFVLGPKLNILAIFSDRLRTAGSVTLIDTLGNLDKNLAQTALDTLKFLYNFFFCAPVLITLAAIGINCVINRQKPKNPTNEMVPLIVAIAYTALILFVAPFKVFRYAGAVFPFFAIVPLILLRAVKKSENFFIFALALCCSFLTPLFDIHKMDVVMNKTSSGYTFLEETEIPVAIACPDIRAQDERNLCQLVPYMADTQRYVFGDTLASIEAAFHFRDFFFIIPTKSLEKETDEINLSGYTIAEKYQWGMNMPDKFTIMRLKSR